MTSAAVPQQEALALAALSTRLTESIASVESQRTMLEEVIMQLTQQAMQLNTVSGVLTSAAHAQGSVLAELQQLLASTGTSAQLGGALQPAAASLSLAADALASTVADAAVPAARSAVDVSGDAPRRILPGVSGPSADASPAFTAHFDSPGDAAPPPSEAGRMRTQTMMPTAPAQSAACDYFGASRPSRAVPVIEPDMDDVGGVEYVKDLKISGPPIVSSTLMCEGEFVGEPTVQWYRSRGAARPQAIEGATARMYKLTVDDVECDVRVECIGPFGGEPVSAAVSKVAPEPSAVAELQRLLLKKGSEKEVPVRTVPGDEQRTLLINREKVKLRKKGKTEWKHDFAKGLGVHLSPYDEQAMSILLDATGAKSVDLAASSSTGTGAGTGGAGRDLIVYLLRGLTGKAEGSTFMLADAAGSTAGGSSRLADDETSEATRSVGSQNEGAEGEDGFMDHLKSSKTAQRSAKTEGGGEDDESDEGEGEEEVFKPAVEFKIRSNSEIEVDPNAGNKLRTASMSLAAPPPPRSRGRSRCASMSIAEDVATASAFADAQAAAGGALYPTKQRSFSVSGSSETPREEAGEASAAVSGPLAAIRKARELHEQREAVQAAARAAQEAGRTAEAAATSAGTSLDQDLGGSSRRTDGDTDGENTPGPSRSCAHTEVSPAGASTQNTVRPAAASAVATPTAPSTKPMATTPGFTPGGTPAIFNLLSIEMVHATFDVDLNGEGGLRPGSFLANGELRAVQLAKADAGHTFRLQIESAANVNAIEPNPGLVRGADDSGTSLQYVVRIPPRPAGTDVKAPFTLMRYKAVPGYQPIPLKIMPRWAFVDGLDRLEMKIAAHPRIVDGLNDVRISVTMDATVQGAVSKPQAEWAHEKRTLTWLVPHIDGRGQGTILKADFRTGSASPIGRTAKPLVVHFVSERCNLTGMAPRPSGGLVGKVMQRFVSGKYVINCGGGTEAGGGINGS
jgi:hypothetical protein